METTSTKKNIITKKGLKELQEELKKLIEIERPSVIEDIKEARGQGDLSENAEFDAARERQGMIEDRIAEIESIIENSEVVKSSKSANKVIIGSSVMIEYQSDKTRETFTVVGTLEADPFENLISNVSPMGQAIINKREGEIATITIDDKNLVQKFDVKIVKIKNS